MTVTIEHKFNSTKSDGVDSTLIQPSHWNDTHDIKMNAAHLAGRWSAGFGPVEEIGLDTTLKFSGSLLGVSDSLDLDRIFFNTPPGISLTSNNQVIQIGPASSTNMIFDANDIQVRNNTAAAPLKLNSLGGAVAIGGDATLLTEFLTIKNPTRLKHTAGIDATSTDHAFQIGGGDTGESGRLCMDRFGVQVFGEGTGIGAVSPFVMQTVAGDVWVGPVGGHAGSKFISHNAAVFELGVTIDGNVAGEAVASQAEAEVGSSNTQLMTPARTRQAITAQRQIYKSGNQTITPALLATFGHGFGVEPLGVQLQLVCMNAEQGYAVGDVVLVDPNASSGDSSRMTSVRISDTNIRVRFSNDANVFAVAHAATGVTVALTNSAWRLRVRAWADVDPTP